MKKIILITAFLVALFTNSYAGEKNSDAAALNILKVLMNSSGDVVWSKRSDYYKRTLMFNGHEISAYFIAEYNVIGLSYKVNVNDLPTGIANCLNKRFSESQISDVIIFMDNDGSIKYYAGVKKGKKYIAVKISSSRKLCVMKKLPMHTS